MTPTTRPRERSDLAPINGQRIAASPSNEPAELLVDRFGAEPKATGMACKPTTVGDPGSHWRDRPMRIGQMADRRTA